MTKLTKPQQRTLIDVVQSQADDYGYHCVADYKPVCNLRKLGLVSVRETAFGRMTVTPTDLGIKTAKELESVTKRAVTPQQKREVLNRILAVWEQLPELRLGQLLSNASLHVPGDDDDIFYIEDTDLAKALESYKSAKGL